MRKEGVHLTGDLGRLDASGALFITGRTELLLEVGGKKVNPLEVERVICDYPGIHECVVLPIPLSDTLSRLQAYMTLSHGCVGIDVNALRQHVRSRLSGYKVPRLFEIRDRFPKSPLGKILRDRIRMEPPRPRS